MDHVLFLRIAGREGGSGVRRMKKGYAACMRVTVLVLHNP